MEYVCIKKKPLFGTVYIAKIDGICHCVHESWIDKQQAKSLPKITEQDIDYWQKHYGCYATHIRPAIEELEITTDCLFTICAHCGKPKSTKRCGACKFAYYCSAECQTKHWQVHKAICSTIKQQYTIY